MKQFHIQLDVLKGTISRLPLVSINMASFMKTLIDMSELRFADIAQARGEYLRWGYPTRAEKNKQVRCAGWLDAGWVAAG